MSLNIRRLRSAVNWVEEQSRTPVRRRMWRQADWFRNLRDGKIKSQRIAQKRPDCQTVCCVAGFLVQRFGTDYEISQNGGALLRGGQFTYWDSAALEVLGLDHSDPAAHVLSDAFNNHRTTAGSFRRAAEKAAALHGKAL